MDHAEHINTPPVGVTPSLAENAIDHSSHGGSGHDGMMMMMSMSFHTTYNETILFSFWKIDTIGGLIGSMIGIFLMAMLYEGLKVLREYLLQCTLDREPLRHHRLDNRNVIRVPLENNGTDADTPETSTVADNVKSLLRPNPFGMSHTIQTFLHMFQALVSYFLMLIFMTYNVWLSLAVILGAGAGYFVFGWRKRTVIDVNEHCH